MRAHYSSNCLSRAGYAPNVHVQVCVPGVYERVDDVDGERHDDEEDGDGGHEQVDELGAGVAEAGRVDVLDVEELLLLLLHLQASDLQPSVTVSRTQG